MRKMKLVLTFTCQLGGEKKRGDRKDAGGRMVMEDLGTGILPLAEYS